jgi:hypothetical protein
VVVKNHQGNKGENYSDKGKREKALQIMKEATRQLKCTEKWKEDAEQSSKQSAKPTPAAQG